MPGLWFGSLGLRIQSDMGRVGARGVGHSSLCVGLGALKAFSKSGRAGRFGAARHVVGPACNSASSTSSKPAARRAARLNGPRSRGAPWAWPVGHRSRSGPGRARGTQVAIPVVAHRHMTDFVAQDDVQDRGRIRVSCGQQFVAHRRRSIQSACLERARHQRQPRQRIVAGLFGHLPQAVVRREVAVVVAQCLQVRPQQLEVQRLLACHANPLPVERDWQSVKAPDHIQRQVDGIELDMGQRMDQHRAALRRRRRAALEGIETYQGRAFGPAGDAGCISTHGVGSERDGCGEALRVARCLARRHQRR